MTKLSALFQFILSLFHRGKYYKNHKYIKGGIK
jgi:hypothetical protein